MLIADLLGTFRKRGPLVSLAVLISIAVGAAVFCSRAELHEVSMLLEVRQDIVEMRGSAMPSIIKELVESGSLHGRLAAVSGSTALPKMKVDGGYNVRLLKVYAYVPEERIAEAARVFGWLPTVLNDEFPADYSGKTGELRATEARIRALERKAERERAGPAIDKVLALSQEALCLSASAGVLVDEARKIKAFDIRMVLSPSASVRPAVPSLPQTLSAFALIGLFCGLAAALSLDNRRQ